MTLNGLKRLLRSSLYFETHHAYIISIAKCVPLIQCMAIMRFTRTFAGEIPQIYGQTAISSLSGKLFVYVWSFSILGWKLISSPSPFRLSFSPISLADGAYRSPTSSLGYGNANFGIVRPIEPTLSWLLGTLHMFTYWLTYLYNGQQRTRQ